MQQSVSEIKLVNHGWVCPSCGRGVAPSEKTCDHGNGNYVAVPFYDYNNPRPARWPAIYPMSPTIPVGPQVGCEACRISGVCMCVRYVPHFTCGSYGLSS